MRKFFVIVLVASAFFCCSSDNKNEDDTLLLSDKKFILSDFYSNDSVLEKRVQKIFDGLTERGKVAQMIVQAAGRLGKPDSEIDRLIQSQSLGGVLLLNGTVAGFKEKVYHFDSMAKAHELLPLIYSADAEPSLIYRKIEGATPVPKTNELKTIKANEVAADKISKDLNEIGIRYNYAPVIDVSPENAAIRNRSYGYSKDSVVMLAGAFIRELQENGIAATAKHFPGHGLVKGDSHSKLVFIDGEMEEVELYKPLIENGVISVMVGHIAVRNNENYSTEGLPASCSKVIVADLLRREMGFQGIITTDAMNMGALKEIPNADFLAVEAGNDMILMPADEEMLIKQMLNKMETDEEFKNQIYASVKRVLRLKICLGIL